MPLLTLLDIAKRVGNDMAVGLIDETTRATPELSGKTFRMGKAITIPNVGAARTIQGTQYKCRVRTALPTFGFRNGNQGVAGSKSTYEPRLVETFLANMKFIADKGIADASEDGPEALLAEEAQAQVLAAMIGLSAQFYYGRNTGGDSLGHPGLIDFVDSTMEKDAQGTTSNGKTSVWFVKFGPQHVQWVFGRNGGLKNEPVRIGDVPDPNDSTKTFTGYIQELMLWAGIQCVNRYGCSRIKNLTAESGHTMTDDLAFQNLSMWPAGTIPDVCFMNAQSLEQLRDSRTATNATGAPAPIPEDVAGIPIALTDSILKTEA